MGVVKGGRNQCDFYRLRKKSDGSGYEVLDQLGDEVVATPTTTARALKLSGLIGSTKPQFQEDGTVKISFDQYEGGEAIWAFLDKVAVAAEETSGQEITLEDGTKIGGSAGDDGELVLAVSYLNTNALAGGTKRFVLAAVGKISAASGSFETSGENYSKPSFEFNGVKNAVAVEIAAAMFDEGVVNVTAAETIPAKKCYIRKYMNLPA